MNAKDGRIEVVQTEKLKSIFRFAAVRYSNFNSIFICNSDYLKKEVVFCEMVNK